MLNTDEKIAYAVLRFFGASNAENFLFYLGNSLLYRRVFYVAKFKGGRNYVFSAYQTVERSVQNRLRRGIYGVIDCGEYVSGI